MPKLNIAEYTHPDVIAALPLWAQMRTTFAGQHAVKAAGTTYLPMTDGQQADYDGNKSITPLSSEETGGSNSRDSAVARYASYKKRAIYPNFVQDTVVSMLGVMYAEKPAKIELPESMAEMKTAATPNNESLEMVMRRTNENQLMTGRRGLLLEPSKTESYKIFEYAEATILNWDITFDENANAIKKFILLDESGDVLKDMMWVPVKKYRILALDGVGDYYSLQVNEDFDFATLDLKAPPPAAIYPMVGNVKLKKIPFEFANASSTLPAPDIPPLLALSDLSIAIYRGDADYRQHLYQQAQDTAFFAGFTADELNFVRLGAGATVGSTNADAKFTMVGVGSLGLSEERTSLENLDKRAINMGVSLVEQKGVESGEALKTRLSVKTASMKTIALTGARAVESLLKTGATWAASNPDEVIIEPNLDFQSSQAAAKELLDLWSTIQQGAPLSNESYHEYMQRNHYTELTYDEELEKIETEGGNAQTIPIQ